MGGRGIVAGGRAASGSRSRGLNHGFLFPRKNHGKNLGRLRARKNHGFYSGRSPGVGFDEPFVVELNDEVGRPVALSASAGADNDLKLRLVEWRMLSM